MLNTSVRHSDTAPDTQTDVIRTSYLPLLDRLRAIPGIQVAALSSVLPLRSEFDATVAGDLDHKKVAEAQTPTVQARLASAGLVEALGIPMLRGRFFTEDDTASSPSVVVVNQAFVSRYLNGLNPIGHTFSLGNDMSIVGVIGDMKQGKVTEATKPEMYFCLAQIQPGKSLYGIAEAFTQVAIRASSQPICYGRSLTKLYWVAPEATTTDVKTIHEAVEDSFGSQTLIAHLLRNTCWPCVTDRISRPLWFTVICCGSTHP